MAFETEEERLDYIATAKQALVRPDSEGFKDLISNFTMAMFESYGYACCARYDPATLNKTQYTEFVDCSYCTYFRLTCSICPVEYVSKNLIEPEGGSRICNQVPIAVYEDTLDQEYFDGTVISKIQDGGIEFMKNGGLEAWKDYAIAVLDGLK